MCSLLFYDEMIASREISFNCFMATARRRELSNYEHSLACYTCVVYLKVECKMDKKYLSGVQKRKRKSDILKEASRQKDSLNKFLKILDGDTKFSSAESIGGFSSFNKDERTENETLPLPSTSGVSITVKNPETDQLHQEEENSGEESTMLQCVNDLTDSGT